MACVLQTLFLSMIRFSCYQYVTAIAGVGLENQDGGNLCHVKWIRHYRCVEE